MKISGQSCINTDTGLNLKGYKAKNRHVETSLLTSGNNLLQQDDINVRLHGWQQFVDDKSSNDKLQRAWF